MFKICLFDLDDTLVRTGDLEEVRLACKKNAEPKNTKQVKVGLASVPNRQIYSADLLEQIRDKYPELKLGVFTRSPRSYADTVLTWAYPGFTWDVVVAYEDVRPTKPHGDGIDLVMKKFGVQELDEVMLVGDTDVDVRAAYNCGCIAVIDRSAWPVTRRTEHWKALALVPDGLFSRPKEILRFLANPSSFLPELERLLSGEKKNAADPRFDRINHFIPQSMGGDGTAFPVYVCGRSFTQYDSLKWRRQWHELTQSVTEHKEAVAFSASWVQAIRTFIVDQCTALFITSSLIVTVVPHRPERKARLEALLGQLKESLAREPIDNCNVTVVADLLVFTQGVRSQHNDHLNQQQRFENVRDHLRVVLPRTVKGGKSVLVVDDVVTTGASLIYATKYLKAAGAGDVTCLAIAKSVGEIL